MAKQEIPSVDKDGIVLTDRVYSRINNTMGILAKQGGRNQVAFSSKADTLKTNLLVNF